MDADAVLKENLIKWVENNRGKDNQLAVYWRMFQVRSMSSNPVKTTPCIGFNLQVGELEESIEMLMENLQVLTHVRFVCIRFMRTSSDNHYLTHHVINPFWSKDSTMGNSPSINGFGGGNVVGFNNQHLSAIKSIHEQEKLLLESKFGAQIEALKMEFLHKNEIKELKEEIAGLKGGNKSLLGELIQDLKEPITTLCTAWATKIMTPENGEGTTNTEPTIHQQAESSNRRFDPLLDNIKNYPHYTELLGEIAVLAKLNPQKLHEIRTSINAAAAETQNQNTKT